MFAKVPLFQDTPVEFLCELSMHVVRYVFSPGEVIIHSDEPVHEMYIVHRGVCQVFLLHVESFRSNVVCTRRDYVEQRMMKLRPLHATA